MMRLLFSTILFALTLSCRSHAEELISGVLAFDPPEFLASTPASHDTTTAETGNRIVRRYAAADNDPRTSQRLLIVSLREVGAGPDAGKTAVDDSQALRDAMQATVKATRNATNVTSVTNAEVGGQPAWRIAYQLPRPYWQKPDGGLLPFELYWVKVQTNQVAEIKLIADSPEHLQSLKTCLSRFKITQAGASAASGSPGATP